MADIVTIAKKFQSTHPREGVRPRGRACSTGSMSFQSTHPREGVRRLHLIKFGNCFSISIHAPPRRSATFEIIDGQVILHDISIHAPPRRSATDLVFKLCGRAGISIHAPPRRSATQ